MNREEGIRIMAYKIWEEMGKCDGNDVQHWLKAETTWQEQNNLLRKAAGTVPSTSNQQFNAAVKTKPAAILNMQQNKKDRFSKRKP